MTIMLLLIAAVLCSATVAFNASSRSAGVFLVTTDSNVPASKGSNPRAFNHVNFLSGGDIVLDSSSGTVTLQPGTYFVSATSNARWSSKTENMPDWASTTTLSGHLELTMQSDAPVAGTNAQAAWGLASSLTATITVTAPTDVKLTHVMDQVANRETVNHHHV
jgi:hypothetical protein